MTTASPINPPSFPKHHWADEVAHRLIRLNPDKDLFTVASGITPSGKVHIGNFREVVTVDLVKRALEKYGKKVRFIFSWDDYDVFRKIPENLPPLSKEQGGTLENFLGRPIVEVPDPFGKHVSYAAHHEKEFEDSLGLVGIDPEFLYQSKKYRRGEYGDQILVALEKKEKIKEILNRYRTQPLAENWWPITIYCKQCYYNDVSEIHFDAEKISYFCKRCKNNFSVKVREASNLKLLWRIDWPMRWKYEQVCFEPGGKDHSSEGGSYDTAKIISREIWNDEPPQYLPYDFVLLKGNGGKMSSSKGNVITLKEILEIYEPEIVRWLFASYRNNVDFSIAFDTDVIRVYESYDRLERIYYGKEDVSTKKKDKLIRIFELSQLNSSSIPTEMRFQPSFRHLVNIVQIHQFDSEVVVSHYKSRLQNKFDESRLRARIQCVVYWLEKYASPEFVFSLNTEKIDLQDLKRKKIWEENYFYAIKTLKEQLEIGLHDKDEVEISDYLYHLIGRYQLDNKSFFRLIYLMLIGKNEGPKLGKFIKLIDPKRLSFLLGK